jgi:hypothetical protein
MHDSGSLRAQAEKCRKEAVQKRGGRSTYLLELANQLKRQATTIGQRAKAGNKPKHGAPVPGTEKAS